MVNIFKNVYLGYSDVYELLAAMFRVQCNEELLSEETSIKRNISSSMLQLTDIIKNSLPTSLKKELEIFFNAESFLGLGLLPLIWKYDKFKDIDEFIDFFTDNVTAKEIVTGFFANGYRSEGAAVEINTLDDAISSIRNNGMPEEEKWKLLYFYNDMENTKARLLKLIRGFYTGYYKNHISDIKNEANQRIEDIKKDIIAEGQKQLEQKLMIKYNQYKHFERIVIVPSYFYGGLSVTSTMGDETFLAIYGMDRFTAEQEDDEVNVIEAFKSISDEKRMKIIQLLNRNQFYGYEIGQQLGLSNSTISHHLALLTKHEVINPVRQENKIYYEVNKERIKSILAKVEALLTK